MAKSAHTPGSWGVEDPLGPDIISIIANPQAPAYDWVHIAQIGTEPIDDDKRPLREHMANAALLAAAPELLAALTAFVENLASQDDEGLIEHAETMIAARAAIAKANGGA